MNWILLSPPPLSPTLTTPQNLERALSEFQVIVFKYKAISDNSELGIFLQSMTFLEFEHSLHCLFPHRLSSGFWKLIKLPPLREGDGHFLGHIFGTFCPL